MMSILSANEYSRSSVQTLESLLWFAFLSLLVWAPLPLASNRVWSAQLLVLGFALIFLVLSVLWLRNALHASQTLRLAAWPIALLVLVQTLVFFQLLPMPEFLLDFLSPVSVVACTDVQVLLPSASCAKPSVVPQITKHYLLLGLAYTAVFVLALQLINGKKRFKQFAYVVILSGVFQAVYGVFAVLSSFPYLLLVDKWSHLGSATGTFVNRNHLGGYLNLVLALGVGLLIAQLKPSEERTARQLARDWVQLILSEKFRLRLLLVVLVVGLVMTHSRGANVAFFTALAVVVLVYFMQLFKRQSSKYGRNGEQGSNQGDERSSEQNKSLLKKAAFFFLSLLVIDVLIVSNWFGLARLKTRLEQTNIQQEGRMDVYNAVLPNVESVGVLGTGVGSAERVIPLMSEWPALKPFQQVHNDYIEFVLTFGWLPFMLLLGFIALCLRQVFVGRSVNYTVLLSLVYLAVHSFSEFTLTIPAFVVTLMAVLALTFTRIRYD